MVFVWWRWRSAISSWSLILATQIIIVILVDDVEALATKAPAAAATGGNRVVPLGSLSVSPVALGSLNLFGDNNNNYYDDKEEIIKLLKALPASTLLDTAEIYNKGRAEAALGAAVREAGVRDRIYFATKFAPQFQRSTPESIVTACQESAQRLGVDAIDLYQVHYADNLRPLVALGVSKEQDEVYRGRVDVEECCVDGTVATPAAVRSSRVR